MTPYVIALSKSVSTTGLCVQTVAGTRTRTLHAVNVCTAVIGAAARSAQGIRPGPFSASAFSGSAKLKAGGSICAQRTCGFSEN